VRRALWARDARESWSLYGRQDRGLRRLESETRLHTPPRLRPDMSILSARTFDPRESIHLRRAGRACRICRRAPFRIFRGEKEEHGGRNQVPLHRARKPDIDSTFARYAYVICVLGYRLSSDACGAHVGSAGATKRESVASREGARGKNWTSPLSARESDIAQAFFIL